MGRAALERNDRIEVVAADQQSRTFTVRVKDTGELRMMRADQVIAGPSVPAPAAAAAASGTVRHPQHRRSCRQWPVASAGEAASRETPTRSPPDPQGPRRPRR